MAPAELITAGYIKIEDTPSPEPILATTVELTSNKETPQAPVEPQDPEGFLKRCSGFKKSKLRCNSVIGKKSEQNWHPKFLPTCRTHRDQQSFAGWCQYQHADGSRCSRLFRWSPPYFQLCSEHRGHPDTPCYFFRLPIELRQQVFSYLLPNRAVGSSTAPLHCRTSDTNSFGPIPGHPLNAFHALQKHMSDVSVFPIPVLSLFLVNRQFYEEAKDLLFSSVPFRIDVRKDGTFMCGRRLLEPRRADGSSHFVVDEADEAKQLFLRNFDWKAVKHYAVDILVENWQSGVSYTPNSAWDEEVELYDIRDYVSVVVSGVLAKARNLCKLQVRICLTDFTWSHDQTLTNTKLLLGPFESLRNVLQPQILAIHAGKPNHNSMLTIQRPPHTTGSTAPICSVPTLPTHTPLLVPGMPAFDTYTRAWSALLSSTSPSRTTPKPPIRTMFTAFKDFYTELAAFVPNVTLTQGRHAFLHRARVAREQEDVEAFRFLRNELIQYWYAYLEAEERVKQDMSRRLGRMLDVDVYPEHDLTYTPTTSSSNNQDTTGEPSSRRSSTSTSTLSPITLNPPSIPHSTLSALATHFTSMNPAPHHNHNHNRTRRPKQRHFDPIAGVQAPPPHRPLTLEQQHDLLRRGCVIRSACDNVVYANSTGRMVDGERARQMEQQVRAGVMTREQQAQMAQLQMQVRQLEMEQQARLGCGVAGPSKRRRGEGGKSVEVKREESAEEGGDVVYVGKGKGKRGVCMD